MTLTNPNVPEFRIPLAAMTPAERVAGRFMRAPDHDAGTAAPAPAAPPAPPAADAAKPEGEKPADDTTALGGTDAAGTKPGEDKPGEEKPKDGEKPAERVAPEKYDLKAPEGIEFDAKAFEAVEPAFRAAGLSNEDAQALVSAYAEKVLPDIAARSEAAVTAQAAAQRKEWADAFDKDPEIGGANKDKTIADAARAFDHYGIKPNEGVRQLLNESGLGNHPDLIRFVAAVGRDLDEGSFERGSAAAQPKTPEAALYAPEFQPKT